MPDDGYKYELQAGWLVSEPLPGFRHGRVMFRVGEMLVGPVRANCLGVVLGGDSGFILARKPDTVRGPDVAFVSNERFAQSGDTVKAFSGAPDLADRGPFAEQHACGHPRESCRLPRRRCSLRLGRRSGSANGRGVRVAALAAVVRRGRGSRGRRRHPGIPRARRRDLRALGDTFLSRPPLPAAPASGRPEASQAAIPPAISETSVEPVALKKARRDRRAVASRTVKQAGDGPSAACRAPRPDG